MASVIRGDDNFDSAGGNAVKAWANFNGTGTPAIRESYNVSSITDTATGRYTANLETSVADSNYSVASAAQGGAVLMFGTLSTTSLNLDCRRLDNSNDLDPTDASFAIFR